MELTIVMSIVLVFLVWTTYLSYHKKYQEKGLQRQGLKAINQIKYLISLVQNHRGLSGALLNGDGSVEYRLSQIRGQIAEQISLINELSASEFGRWKIFLNQWQGITAQGKQVSAVGNFEQHTRVIKNLAWLLEDVAEQAHLTADFLPEFVNIGFVWRELLQSTESIGQCRAIGTGVAVQKACSSVDKIRLSYQIKVMQDISENTLQNLSCLPEEKSSHDKLIREATNDMNHLIAVISEDLIKQSRVTLDSQDYFNQATDTMKCMNQIFEHQVKQLARAI